MARTLSGKCITRPHRVLGFGVLLALILARTLSGETIPGNAAHSANLPKIVVDPTGPHFVNTEGKPFIPLGVTYYHPGTGWAPQVWRQFDASLVRQDLERMKALGVNCVRVFLSYGSFYREPGKLDPAGLDKFDQFLGLAEEAGIYVQVTGPDYWEGSPGWGATPIEEERSIELLEEFWKQFAARYRSRNVIFAYDLQNEPTVGWNASMQSAWNTWLRSKYLTGADVAHAWNSTNALDLGAIPVPVAERPFGSRPLLDFQEFREDLADKWTRRLSGAIKSVDSNALVTVGCIQWSVPSLLPAGPSSYSGFRSDRQARLLDFLEIHFYPLAAGAYEYRNPEEEAQNLAYLEGIVRETARPGKPVVLAEFGWYGGGRPNFDQRSHPFASEEQQAEFCRQVVETSRGYVCGWLNWGLYDDPQAGDCSELTGLLTSEGKVKSWGYGFRRLAGTFSAVSVQAPPTGARPQFNWEACSTDVGAGEQYRSNYLAAFLADQRHQRKSIPFSAVEKSSVGVPWPATDSLGRSLPLNDEVGPPRADRFVGIFYFLTHGRHGDRGPFDISKILAQHPAALSNAADPLWGPLFANHHWGESIFGYYVSEDEAVLRKHAQMLSDAGVDVIIFDVSNQLTYPESWLPLCRVFEHIRHEGGSAPQIAFLCPFGNPGKVIRELWNQLYSQAKFQDLWFRWEGKPLILADPESAELKVYGEGKIPDALPSAHTLGQLFVADQAFVAIGAAMPTWASRSSGVTLTLYRPGPGGERMFTGRFTRVKDNSFVVLKLPQSAAPGRYYLEASLPQESIGWWGQSENAVPGGQAFQDGKPVPGCRVLAMKLAGDSDWRAAFTFRTPQPDYFSGPTGPNQWGWLEVYPQQVFTNSSGANEEMPVGVAQNAVQGRLSVMSNPQAHGRSFHDGVEPGPANRDYTGRNFAEQWQRALAVDPQFIFITGWNEWTAMRFNTTVPSEGMGPVTFVDLFDEEFSRDVEPMKGGHEDGYYYQMVANIRRYKGVPAIPPIQSRPIMIDGRFDDWSQVEPKFSDTAGDPVKRSFRGYGHGSRYENQTGRNDIVASKVSADGTNIYFYVRTRAPLTPISDANWMLLFIDVDQNPKTGWLGYDFVVNRLKGRDGVTTIEKNGGGYHWELPKEVPFRARGKEIELAIPWTFLGLTNTPTTIDFKWADNIQQTGEWSDFTLNGDVAPNDRFNFRAVFKQSP